MKLSKTTTDPFAPSNMAEAMELAEMLSKSSIVPKDFQGNPGNVFVAMQWGHEIGLPVMQALQNISVINGRPAMWGDAMLGLVRASGLLDFIDEKVENDVATCTVRRRGEDNAVRTFSKADAQTAKLWTKPGSWQEHPKRMLQMRARAFALRDVFPDVLRGLYTVEEARDIVDITDYTETGSEQKQIQGGGRLSLADKVKKGKEGLQAEEQDVVQEVVQMPTLEDVLKAIDGATTREELSSTADLATHLPDAGKRKARTAYRKKAAEFDAQEKAEKEGTAEFLADMDKQEEKEKAEQQSK